MSVFQQLTAPFEPDAVHWRAQSISKKNPDAPKALALAYMDARDVMERLDAVVGPENWSDRYDETPTGRVVCVLSLRIEDEWIAKSDGAGSTQVEAEKGGLSDAFKRAAVKWGIGRYLYGMPTPWVPCKLYNDKWSEWTPEGLKQLRALAASVKPDLITDSQVDEIMASLQANHVTTGDFLATCKLKRIPDLTASRFEGAMQWISENRKEAA